MQDAELTLDEKGIPVMLDDPMDQEAADQDELAAGTGNSMGGSDHYFDPDVQEQHPTTLIAHPAQRPPAGTSHTFIQEPVRGTQQG